MGEQNEQHGVGRVELVLYALSHGGSHQAKCVARANG
jgi:hypothetical protein